MTKQKFRQYKLSDLSPGDRFYFAGDKKKRVYTLNDQHPFEKQIQKGFTIFYANARADNPVPGQLQVERFKANRRVIFLRNINSIDGSMI